MQSEPIPATTRRVLRLGVLSTLFVAGTLLAPVHQTSTPQVHEQVIDLADDAAAAQRSSADEGRAGALSVPLDNDPEMVGFSWDGADDATIRVRGREGERWSEWLELEGELAEGPDAGSSEFTGRRTAGPAWLGHDLSEVEVRIMAGGTDGLRLHALDTENAEPATNPFGVEPAGATLPVPGIISRAQWGADESLRTVNCDGQPDYASTLRYSVVHHTVNSNNYTPADSAALIRGIYHFHVFGNGWCDIGYNFLVDRYGQMFEGRFGGINMPVIGGHAGGFNTSSTGVAVIGDFTASAVPAAAYEALVTILTWKLGYHGVNPQGTTTKAAGDSPSARWPVGTIVTLPNIEGHIDSNFTSCPGQYLYSLLPQLRVDVAQRIASAPSDTRLMCDWNGDGTDTPAWVQDGYWYIKNSNSAGYPDIVVPYGLPSWQPICGDWDGNGVDTIGAIADGNVWALRNSNTPGFPNIVFIYGMPEWQKVVGDWNGDGRDTPGAIADGNLWALRNSNTQGLPEIVFRYGMPQWQKVVGDWNGDGRDTVGAIADGYIWALRDSNTAGFPEVVFPWGEPGDRPLVGDFREEGRSRIGVARGSWWFLANNVSADGFPF